MEKGVPSTHHPCFMICLRVVVVVVHFQGCSGLDLPCTWPDSKRRTCQVDRFSGSLKWQNQPPLWWLTRKAECTPHRTRFPRRNRLDWCGGSSTQSCRIFPSGHQLVWFGMVWSGLVWFGLVASTVLFCQFYYFVM